MIVDEANIEETELMAEEKLDSKLNEIALEPDSEEMMEYPADCFSDDCYRKFPFLLGDEESPFWQGWANLRFKTFLLIENKYFETAVITMILLSSLALVSFASLMKIFSFCLISILYLVNAPIFRRL